MNLKEDIVTEIQAIGSEFAIQKIVLFGSRARGDHSPNSDIDLAVFPAVGFKQAGTVAAQIDGLDTLLKVDMVFITPETNSQLLDLISLEGVVLYEQKTE